MVCFPARPALSSMCLSLLALACGGTGPADGFDVEAVQASAPASMHFLRSFSTQVAQDGLHAGQAIQVHYDADRMYDIVNGSSSVGHFASAHHCYGYGCCEVQFSNIEMRWRTDEGAFVATPLAANGTAHITLPTSARHLEVYFFSPGYDLKTWYCGCGPECGAQNRERAGFGLQRFDAYDSRFGENYRFDVSAPVAPLARRDDGQWASNWAAPSGIRYGWQWDANVWVDLLAASPDEGRSVGIRWTVDGWQSHQDTLAQFEGLLASGQAQWGVDLTPVRRMQSCAWCTPEPVTLEYAIFTEADGVRTWNNADGANYQISLRTDYE